MPDSVLPAGKDPARRRFGYCLLPYLAAMSLPLAVLSANLANLPSLTAIARTMGLLLALVALADIIARLLIRKSPARELMLLALIVYLGAYGHVYRSALAGVIGHRYLIPAWTGMFLVSVWAVRRNAQRPVLRQVASFVQLAATVFLMLQVAGLGVAVVPDILRIRRLKSESTMVGELSSDAAREDLPDIYYVILDSYGREDTLRELYGYDNRPFLDALKQRGFRVTDRARANYPQTRYSLASSMNMSYLDRWDLAASRSNVPLQVLIRDSELTRALKECGYTTVAFATGYSPTHCRSFDRYLGDPFFTEAEFLPALYATTLLAPVLKERGMFLDLSAHRRRVLRMFAMLPEVAEEDPSPTFVFAHIMPPHPPFIFDGEGNEVRRPGNFPSYNGGADKEEYEQTRGEYIEGYRDQLVCVNKKTLDAVDRILATRSQRSIIILQADHGPASITNDAELFGLTNKPEDATGKDERALADAALRERFSIFTAIYVPPGVDIGLYEDMTPVNTFRLILDHYFRTDLGTLEDKCLIPTKYGGYEFRDVTERVVQQPAS